MHLIRLSKPCRAGGLPLALAAVISVVSSAPVMAAPAPAAVRCGTTIRTNITLRTDLRGCAHDGLVVGANHITINLNGHTLDGTGNRLSAGVRVAGFKDVIVKGGVIREFGRGIWLINAVRSRVLDNTVTNNFDEGVFANERSSSALIKGNSISGSGALSGATWADGIDARGSGLTITTNSVNGNHDDGIDANGDNDRVVSNTVDANGIGGHSADGIDIDGHNTLVQNNIATNNYDDGIGTGAHAGNVTITGNLAVHNHDRGIQPKAGTAVDGGGNKAADNGAARQCVFVVCTAPALAAPAVR